MAGVHQTPQQQQQHLAPCVFLAFNDFSLAGQRTDTMQHHYTSRACMVCYVLQFAQAEGLLRVQQDDAQADGGRLGLSVEFAEHVDVWHLAARSTDAPVVSFIVVNNAAIEESKYWALADALLTLLSDANVQVLTVVASLHLPYAKPSTTAAIPNVYHSVLNVECSSSDVGSSSTTEPPVATNGSHFQQVDATWEIKDRFLSSLVHLLKVEQSPRVHFLLAKGYKPGRDHTGTYEAADALVAAVTAFTDNRVTFNAQAIAKTLPRRLATKVVDVNAQHQSDHHTLLYQ